MAVGAENAQTGIPHSILDRAPLTCDAVIPEGLTMGRDSGELGSGQGGWELRKKELFLHHSWRVCLTSHLDGSRSNDKLATVQHWAELWSPSLPFPGWESRGAHGAC